MDRFWKYKLDHVIFWVATVAFHMFTRSYLVAEAGAGQFVLEILIRNGLLAVVIYVNLLVLIPRFLPQRQFFRYTVFLLVLLTSYAFAKNIHDVYLYGEVLQRPGSENFSANTFYNLSIALFYVCFSIALHLSREWYNQRELIRKIEIEKLNTELAYLRSQINPHFLFNSINTIYFQIDKKNTEARETLSTFSEMLRYQLYECNGKEVPIEKEINYLQNYIDLQRLRKGENYRIEFESDPNVGGFTIAPLVLICFVENAFKHVSHHAEGNRIKVILKREDATFRMSVFNTWDGRERVNDEMGGIGLKNVKRRLELLYPGRHMLDITAGQNDFKVDLTLRLEST
ncbi:MAG TPA: histidine kinase [Chryseosolibacter sp.]|nr:histidine kinase [Chryseosolibacter sp.]